MSRGAEVWKLNPALDIDPVFDGLKEKWGPEGSGDVVLAIYLVHSPLSPLLAGNFSKAVTRRKKVRVLIPEGFKWASVELEVNHFVEEYTSDIEKELEAVKNRVRKLRAVVEEWQPTKEEVLDFAKASEAALKHEQSYLELKKSILKKESTDYEQQRGGGDLSFLEKIGISGFDRAEYEEG